MYVNSQKSIDDQYNTKVNVFCYTAQRQPELPGRRRTHMRVLRSRGRQPPVGYPHTVPQGPAAHLPAARQPAPQHQQLQHQLHQLQLQYQELPQEPRTGMQLHHLQTT